ncbi:hypothetical protein KY290_031057 [Solanum tuberosum]|uniref:Uncharacterized protein n=1 Tax=Solanum tuberosum TaxID=4113 RepID=A0ABQ7U825_SOLTU|nr:hypothetical protein KY290_031057 [Solanum tuberosum]
MEALHALVSHQEGKLILAEHYSMNLVKEASGSKDIEEYFEGENESNMLQVCKEASLSSKLLTRERKGKSNRDRTSTIPSRV